MEKNTELSAAQVATNFVETKNKIRPILLFNLLETADVSSILNLGLLLFISI